MSERTPDPTGPRPDTDLGRIEAALAEFGAATRFFPADDQRPVASLVVDLGPDEAERARSMTISELPSDDEYSATRFVQFYMPVPFVCPDDRRGDVGHAMAVVNAAMVIGHFALHGAEIFYRYVMALPESATLSDEVVDELFPLLVFHAEHFADYLEGVIDDEISLLVLADLIAQSD